MKKSKCILAAGAAVLTMGAWSAGAATLSFSSWATTTDNPVIDTAPTVNVDDTTNADFLTFTVSIPNSNGELSGIWLDFGNDPTFASSDLMSLTTGVTINSFTTAGNYQGGNQNKNDIGNGRTLGGNFTAPQNGNAGTFDLGFGFDDGDNGGGSRQIALPYSFKISTTATGTGNGTVGLDGLDRIGLRFQSVGIFGQNGLGGGSEKLIGVPDSQLVPTPLPPAGWMLVAGLGCLIAMRRRKKA